MGAKLQKPFDSLYEYIGDSDSVEDPEALEEANNKSKKIPKPKACELIGQLKWLWLQQQLGYGTIDLDTGDFIYQEDMNYLSLAVDHSVSTYTSKYQGRKCVIIQRGVTDYVFVEREIQPEEYDF